jgi:4-hydroxy-3-methylbut-2-enyl diphosphate reductase
MKKDFKPTLLDFCELQIYLARHFGFCYGVENAIDIAFRTVAENPGRRIFLLSEMIHNPQVNADLTAHGIQFLQDTSGKQLIPFDSLTSEDIVLIPAFGTTLEIQAMLEQKGIPAEKYNTTCPFVEKVWNRSEVIAKKNYTIVIHGKPGHEETRATFSHAAANGPAIIIKDMAEAIKLAAYIKKELPAENLLEEFKGQFSTGFNPKTDLERIGVVNQTTMLASDTQAIADYLKEVIKQRDGAEENAADTRDTLCYATNDNQTAVAGLLETTADLAIVVGGYNSSNTSHLVELCEEKLPTYFINNADKIISATEIHHFDLHQGKEVITTEFIPPSAPIRVLITSGASCPDALVEAVIAKLHQVLNVAIPYEKIVEQFS